MTTPLQLSVFTAWHGVACVAHIRVIIHDKPLLTISVFGIFASSLADSRETSRQYAKKDRSIVCIAMSRLSKYSIRFEFRSIEIRIDKTWTTKSNRNRDGKRRLTMHSIIFIFPNVMLRTIFPNDMHNHIAWCHVLHFHGIGMIKTARTRHAKQLLQHCY